MSANREQYRQYYRTLGLRIQYFRKSKGYTQEAFAELVDISGSFLSQVESSASLKGISLETLFKMAEVLEIEPYQLLQA